MQSKWGGCPRISVADANTNGADVNAPTLDNDGTPDNAREEAMPFLRDVVVSVSRCRVRDVVACSNETEPEPHLVDPRHIEGLVLAWIDGTGSHLRPDCPGVAAGVPRIANQIVVAVDVIVGVAGIVSSEKLITLDFVADRCTASIATVHHVVERMHKRSRDGPVCEVAATHPYSNGPPVSAKQR